MSKNGTDQIKKLFDNAVAATFANKDLEKVINEQIEKTITTAIMNAVDDWEIRKIVEKKITEAINIENLDFGNYGKFIEDVFIKAVKDFQLDDMENRLKDIAKSILGAPDKKEYDLWEDILRPIIADFTEEEESNIEEFGYDAYASYKRSQSDYGSEWIYIKIKEKHSSFENIRISLYHNSNKDIWELISYTGQYGFEISKTNSTITFCKSYDETKKRIINLVMKGCTLTNVDTALSYLSEE